MKEKSTTPKTWHKISYEKGEIWCQISFLSKQLYLISRDKQDLKEYNIKHEEIDILLGKLDRAQVADLLNKEENK